MRWPSIRRGRASESASEKTASGRHRRHENDVASAEGYEDPVFLEEDSGLISFPEPEYVSSRRRLRRGLVLIGIALGVLVAIVATLYFSPLLTIRSVEVEHNDLLSDAQAEEMLQPVYGVPLPQVGNRQVEDLLSEEAVVEDVIVTGELPDTLRVQVIEYPPVAEVVTDEEIRFYNEHGDIIRAFDEDEAPESEEYATPRINEGIALRDEDIFDAIVAVLGALPADAREHMESATAESVDSVELELDDGRSIVWGSEERSAEKAAVLEAILRSEAEEFTGADVIDISTPTAPVTRDSSS
ncbi:MAG TPA: FtsQ-type POTRA domain-containing protein [Candidatus Nesterenkonia stercoripullorum]|uniref:FtsQ-type POTRA domain-containing protein n=1 Tax=Candidatus Nesterenkonia stercoripullorum TaxID=2838701 RepID=A0A9D1S122_9MICC|nr:FtsQ-type POTRA domain-containing protein [Candidatus Nesterenkonia stercoripullorum]